MRGSLFAAAALMACAAAPAASAQNGDAFTGTWAFQTNDYGNAQYVVAMSGVAVVTPSAPGRYDIRLIANEIIGERSTGRTQLITAREACTGEVDGEVFNIACQMAEPLEGYEPDNFILQSGEESDQMVGVLSSAASGQVTFTRMR
ncbi:MAG: hypothetical protein R3C16_07470 [Hyphomonadaceae bacterium]